MRAVGGGAGDVGEDGRVRGPAARRSPAPPRGGTGAVFPGAAPRAAGPQGSGRTGGHRKRRCGRYRKQHGPTIGGIRLSRYVGSEGVRVDARQTPVPVRARRRQGRGRTAHSPPDTAKGTRPSGGRPAPTVRNRGGAAIMPYRPMAGRSSPEAEHTLRSPKAAVPSGRRRWTRHHDARGGGRRFEEDHASVAGQREHGHGTGSHGKALSPAGTAGRRPGRAPARWTRLPGGPGPRPVPRKAAAVHRSRTHAPARLPCRSRGCGARPGRLPPQR